MNCSFEVEFYFQFTSNVLLYLRFPSFQPILLANLKVEEAAESEFRRGGSFKNTLNKAPTGLILLSASAYYFFGAAEVALRAAAIAALEDIASLLDSSVFCGIGS